MHESDLAIWVTYIRLCCHCRHTLSRHGWRCNRQSQSLMASCTLLQHYYRSLRIHTYRRRTVLRHAHSCMHACMWPHESRNSSALTQTHACRRGVSKVKPSVRSFKQLSSAPCIRLGITIFHCPNRATGRRQGKQRRGGTTTPRRTGDHCPRHATPHGLDWGREGGGRPRPVLP